MPIQPHIEIRGLKQLARKLRGIDRDLARELQRTNKTIAEKVAAEARSQVPVRTGHAAGSVKARASAQRSSVVGGGPTVPYYPWLEFGGTIRPRGTPIVRPRAPGRYILAAVRKEREVDVDTYVDALNDILRRADLI
jgi:hypothetical protein